MQRTVLLTPFVGLGLLLCARAAWSSGGVSGDVAFVSVAHAAAAPPPVSFRKDVAPLLVVSCTTASCHGSGAHPPDLTPEADASALRRALVAVPSEERLSLPYVRPGDPDGSYLLEKLEGRLNDAQCTDHDCGSRMPARNSALPPQAQATIRAWVAQGAADN